MLQCYGKVYHIIAILRNYGYMGDAMARLSKLHFPCLVFLFSECYKSSTSLSFNAAYGDGAVCKL